VIVSGSSSLSKANRLSILNPGQTYLDVPSETGVTHDATIALQVEVYTWPALGANVNEPYPLIFQCGL